jgi:hypothetical protein
VKGKLKVKLIVGKSTHNLFSEITP